MTGRQAFEVVDAFEQAVARYTGAPYCVAVDSGCNAIFLALMNSPRAVSIPRKTYVGVPWAIKNARLGLSWRDENWSGIYELRSETWNKGKCYHHNHGRIYDAALRFTSNMYLAESIMCLSIQASKLLPIGRGGAILHDNPKYDVWFRKMRNNGRKEGALCGKEHGFHDRGFTMYMTPPDAARGLWLLTYYPEHMPDQPNDFDDISGEEIFK